MKEQLGMGQKIGAGQSAAVAAVAAGGLAVGREAVKNACQNVEDKIESKVEKIEERSKLIKNVTNSCNTRYEYFALKAAEARIVYGMGREDYACLKQLFYEFIEKSFAFYGEFFKKNAFEGETELLPISCRLAVHLKKALDSEKEGNLKQTLEYIKACAGVFPSFDPAIKAYAVLYGEEKKREKEKKEEAAKEVKKDMQKIAL